VSCHGRRVRSISLLVVLNMRAMRDADPPTPWAAGFGVELLLCEPVGVLVV
jgi:hypothetical protein